MSINGQIRSFSELHIINLIKGGGLMSVTQMNFIKRTVALHNNRQISILIPFDYESFKVTAVEDIGDNLILTDGSGYAFLSRLFAFAASLNQNEVIYFPFGSWQSKELNSTFPDGFYSGMVIVNYCNTQITNKDIGLILKTKIYTETFLSKSCIMPEVRPQFWKSKNRLTIKRHATFIIICTNGDVFSNLAISCIDLSEYGDDASLNLFPHSHHDIDENTSKSLGINLFYWHDV